MNFSDHDKLMQKWLEYQREHAPRITSTAPTQPAPVVMATPCPHIGPLVTASQAAYLAWWFGLEASA